MQLNSTLELVDHDKNYNVLDFPSVILNNRDLEHRKQYGQFYTSQLVARYMTSLIRKPENNSIYILDAGAGSGVLSIEAALACVNFGIKEINITLYEIDKEVIPYLNQELLRIKNKLSHDKVSLLFSIYNEDFVLVRPDKNPDIPEFNIAIINPPYFKYNVKSSKYAKAVSDLYKGDPNIYASFMGIVINCLAPQGQMISITPRSFTNGLYFKGFRRYLLSKVNIDLIHIFKKRDKIFKYKSVSVLQENIICSFTKGRKSDLITIRSCKCDTTLHEIEESAYPANLIADESNDEVMIRVPETSEDAKVLQMADKLPTTFDKSDYYISTGPIVEHRTMDFIVNSSTIKNSVPLYRSHNIKFMEAVWNGQHKKDVKFLLKEQHDKHTLQNGNYVLVKRFSSKDEKKRLIAGVYNSNLNNHMLIGFGNKINYIGSKNRSLTLVEAYGLSAVFNSSFMDSYFRCLSGNTQVNATEIRIMRFPKIEQIIRIGRQVMGLELMEQININSIVNRALGLPEF